MTSSFIVGVTAVAIWLAPSIAAPSTRGMTGFSIAHQRTTLSFNAPAAWGKLAEMKTDRTGRIAEGRYEGRFLDIPYLGKETTLKAGALSAYNVFQPACSTCSRVAPTVTIGRFPTGFSDDPDLAITGSLTKETKENIFAPLKTLYRDKSLRRLPLKQTRMTDTADRLHAPTYIGGWWGNVNGINSDRVGITALENAKGNLRGIGFFVIEGTGTAFRPFYRVVLIDAKQLVLVTMTFPIDGLNELKTYGDPANLRALAQGYGYLDSPRNYTRTPLGSLLLEIRNAVRTMQLK